MKQDLCPHSNHTIAALPLGLLPERAHRGGPATPLRTGASAQCGVDQGATR